LEKGQEIFRLRLYEIYAWGVPTLITLVAAVLDHLPEDPNDAFLRPRFGENKCWFYGEFLLFLFANLKNI
jgi:G protein-coupled receptor Mth (Methuselah protein)